MLGLDKPLLIFVYEESLPSLSNGRLWTFPVSCTILVKWGQTVSENITFLKGLGQDESETNFSNKEKLFPHILKHGLKI